jgi:hypothetical protein
MAVRYRFEFRCSVSCCEGADFDEVAGEDAVSAPGSGAVDVGEFGAVPAIASLEVVDPSFGPVRHLILSLKARRCSNSRRATLGLLARGIATLRTPSWCRSCSTDAWP